METLLLLLSSYPQLLLLIIFFITCTYLIFSKSSFTTNPTTTHGFKIYPLVGALPEFLLNRHRFLHWSAGVLSACPTQTAVITRPGKVQGVLTANPSNVEHILKTNFDNYPKGARFTTFLRDFLGSGIFNSDGDLWWTQRKTASHEFSTKSLRNFFMDSVTVEIRTRLIPLLRSAARNNRVIDLQDVLERFAFDNICKVAFDVDPGCLGSESDGGGVHEQFMRAFEEAASLSSGRFMYAIPNLYKIKKFLNVGSERRLRKSIRTVHEFADEIIRSRAEETTSSKKEDLLSRFIGGDTGNSSPEFLRDIVISFILAGRDTTSSALSWFFWLLSSRPDVEKRILKELEGIHREGEYTFEDLRKLNYLQAAISESMRLYPPVPVDTKVCGEDDVLPDGTFVGKDWFVSYHTYAMGRVEGLWGEDCEEYRPERWMDEKNGVCRQESPYRFPVFHAGPRMCLGREMAYVQMKSIVAAVAERFEMEMAEKEKMKKEPEHLLSLTLRMKDGLLVRVKEKSNRL